MNFQTGILPAIAVVSLGAVMATLPALRPEPAQGQFAKLTSYPEQPRTPEASSVRLASYSAPAKPSSSAYTAHSLRAVSGVLRHFNHDEKGQFDRTLTVSGEVDLDVQTGSGNISVKQGSASQVEVHAKIYADDRAGSDVLAHVKEIEQNPPIVQSGNTIKIGHIDRDDWKKHISISYEIVTPAQSKVRTASGSGDVSVGGVAGPLEAESGSGNLGISQIGNEVHARTGSGDIDVNGVKGGAKVSTGSGSIHAQGIAGGITASSGSGDIQFAQTAPGDVDIQTGSGSVNVTGANGALKASSGSGGISVQGTPTGDWRLHTGSGDLEVKLPSDASFNLVARAQSGSIDSNRQIMVQGKMSPHELSGKVGNGGPTVELATSSGSIQIR
jgi:DUF4097 and DUF4098 domain-containing protein YvlB